MSTNRKRDSPIDSYGTSMNNSRDPDKLYIDVNFFYVHVYGKYLSIYFLTASNTHLNKSSNKVIFKDLIPGMEA